MGGGSFCFSDYTAYSKSVGKTIDCCTRAISSGQEWHAHDIDEDLDPKNVIRECCNSDEHPNTLPVILALDVMKNVWTGYFTEEDIFGFNLAYTDEILSELNKVLD